MSLRRQFLSVFLALFLTVLLAIVLVSVSGTRRYLEQQLASHAQDAATALSVTLGQSLGKGDAVLAEAHVMSMFDRGYFKSIDVLAPDRKLIVKREMPEKIEGVPLWFASLFPIDSGAGEAFIGSGWKQLGKVLVVSQPTFAYQYLWSTTASLLAWIVALCGVAWVLVELVLHFILKPLRAIEKTAKDVQAKRFEPISYKPRAPELATVVTAMNQMSQRVREMLDAETAKAQALHQKAYQDELTGLLNRAGFELALSELLDTEHAFALGSVVSVELDDMRLLKRAQGFAASERIIRAVTDNARAVFAGVPSALLARSNEFSFTFVAVDVTEVEATALATELRRRIMTELADNADAKMVAINMGVAFFRQQEVRAVVYSRVDLAIESARQSSRNGFRVLAAEPDENSSLGSMGWRALIQTALLEKRLRLLSQPVLSLDATQTVLQGERMARLLDEHGEMILASSFMPMAARHRLMPDVDRAMVTLALGHIKSNRDELGLVAINLSPQSIVNAEFMKWFGGQLAQLKDVATRLAVEVPKYGVTSHMNAALQLRDLVRKHGGKFGIDNFGLDPQALRLLREIPPDYVKLTGSLTTELATVETAREMLQSFVKLAHSLDVLVIAQQVENKDQVTALAAAEVDAGQGYFFGAPK